MKVSQRIVYTACTCILVLGVANVLGSRRRSYFNSYLTRQISCQRTPSTRDCSFCWCAVPLPRDTMPSALNPAQVTALNKFRDWFINDQQSAETLYDRTQPVFELTERQKQAILNDFRSFFQQCENFDEVNKVCLDPSPSSSSSSRIARSNSRICSVIKQTTPYFAALMAEGNDPAVVVQISLEIFQEFDEELCATSHCNYYPNCQCQRNFRLARAIIYNTEQQEIYTPTIGDIKVRSCHAYRQ